MSRSCSTAGKKGSCRKSEEDKRYVFLHPTESSKGPLQNPVLAQLLSLGEEESGNMMDVAMLLKAQALSLTKHIRIKPANLSVPLPEVMISCMNYLLALCRNYKCKSAECLVANSRSQSIWLWFQRNNFPGTPRDCPCAVLCLTCSHLGESVHLKAQLRDGLEEKLALWLQCSS